MIVVYIAGPYRARTPWQVEQNTRAAEALALEVWRAGLTPLCPHTMTRHMDGEISDEAALAGTLELMRRCDAVLLVPGWERSMGTQAELAEARRLGLPAFVGLDALLYAQRTEAMREPRRRKSAAVVVVDGQRYSVPGDVAEHFKPTMENTTGVLHAALAALSRIMKGE